MASDGELISLLAFTIGSIGQIVKDVSTLKDKYTSDEGYKEIKRIYKGYVNAIKLITNQN